MLHSEFKDKVSKLEQAGFDWHEIAYFLETTYDKVRRVAEEDD